MAAAGVGDKSLAICPRYLRFNVHGPASRRRRKLYHTAAFAIMRAIQRSVTSHSDCCHAMGIRVQRITHASQKPTSSSDAACFRFTFQKQMDWMRSLETHNVSTPPVFLKRNEITLRETGESIHIFWAIFLQEDTGCAFNSWAKMWIQCRLLLSPSEAYTMRIHLVVLRAIVFVVW